MTVVHIVLADSRLSVWEEEDRARAHAVISERAGLRVALIEGVEVIAGDIGRELRPDEREAMRRIVGDAQAGPHIITEEQLGQRPRRCLQREGLVTWEQVAVKTDEELLTIPNFGNICLEATRAMQEEVLGAPAVRS